MKFPPLYAVVFLLFIGSILAGCSTPASNQSPSQSPVNTNLSDFVLSGNEMPFTVQSVRTTKPNMMDPTISRFGGKQGFTRYVTGEMTGQAQPVQLGQVMVEYPPGNATRAFETFVNLTGQTDPSQNKITWLADPGIGEKSCAFTVADKTGAKTSLAMIVFVKSDIMESVTLVSPSPDIDMLTRTARAAAARIPA